METILNLVWLVVTLAVIWLWRYRWTVSRRDARHTVRLQVVALICFIALLFPVISLTDDLHPEIMVADAVGGKRNSCLLIAGAPHARFSSASSVTHVAVSTLPRPFALVHTTIAESVPTPEVRIPISFTESHLGRSPPATL